MAFVHWTGALCWAGVTNTCTVLIGVPVPHRCNLQVYLYLAGVHYLTGIPYFIGVPLPYRCTCYYTGVPYLIAVSIHTLACQITEPKKPNSHSTIASLERPQSPHGIKLLCEDVPFPVIRPLAIVTSMRGELNYFIMSNLKKGREW